MTSPFAILYNEVLLRLKDKAPLLQYIEQDFQQLENYEMRPPVKWPCALIEVDNFSFTDAGNELKQMATGILQVRIGQVAYSPSSGYTVQQIRDKALAFYETEQQIYAALHGWNPEGFSKLLRRAAALEARNDDLRVRVLRFEVNFEDTTNAKVRTPLTTPSPTISTKP